MLLLLPYTLWKNVNNNTPKAAHASARARLA
jgi:hypothetical protein